VATVEHWRRRFAAVVTRAGELLLAQGDGSRALTLAERALSADPWLERAHGLVVAAHRANDDDPSARQAATRYRQIVSELGVDQHEATRMAERLLSGSQPTT
jgi:hypothetical protein